MGDMREKYESLALNDLKELAKARGIKGVSTMKKPDVIEAMLALDEEVIKNYLLQLLKERLLWLKELWK